MIRREAYDRPVYLRKRRGGDWWKRNVDAWEATGTVDLSPLAFVPRPL